MGLVVIVWGLALHGENRRTLRRVPECSGCDIAIADPGPREAMGSLKGFGGVRLHRILAAGVVCGVMATACADTSSQAETDADLAVDPEACDAAAAYAVGALSSTCAALDPSVDGSEFTVDQIAPTDREEVPSALDNSRDAAFPPALIDLDRVLSGGPPPDGIPSIDDPVFQNAAAVDWLAASEAVVSLEIDGEPARAYPIQVMTWHELVNDTIGDVPVTISYCPLCNSALAYDRRLGDRVLDFGTSGRLFNSSLVMYDRQTETLWTHFDGVAVAGQLTGEELDTYPISTTSWEDFRTAHPDGLVLTRNTGFSRNYGANPYEGYDAEGRLPFLFDGEYDPRLDPKARVVVVRADNAPAVALPLSDLLEPGVVAFAAHGRDIVALLDLGTASPLDRAEVAAGYDQGAVGVFVDEFEDAPLDLSRTPDGFLDATSGVTFDIFGRALDGSDRRLAPVEHLDTFWFAIAAFDAGTVLVGES